MTALIAAVIMILVDDDMDTRSDLRMCTYFGSGYVVVLAQHPEIECPAAIDMDTDPFDEA